MRQLQVLRSSVLCVLLLGLWGCSQAKDHPADPDIARSALEEALQAWKEGRTPKDLQPDMYVTDPAWEAGKKLESFTILDEEDADGSNVHLRVTRKISPPDPAFDPTVKYIISTTPAITIVPQ